MTLDTELLSSLIYDNIEEFLSKFELEYNLHNNRITLTCPIHGSNNIASLSIYPSNHGNWKCWTNHCELQYGKNLIGLIRGLLSTKYSQEFSYKETIDFIFKSLNKNPDKFSISKEVKDKRNFAKTLNYLSPLDNGGKSMDLLPARYRSIVKIPSQYFSERGFSKEILVKYDVGDCINPVKPMFQRAIVPIFDETHSKIIGCSGRTFRPKCQICNKFHFEYESCFEGTMKWKHNEDFRPTNLLYNYWFAKESIEKTEKVVIVESPGNVWKFSENGLENVVAIMGAQLSQNQQILLEKSGATNIILVLDNDEAGLSASDTLKKRLERAFNVNVLKISELCPEYNDIAEIPNNIIQDKIIPLI